MSDTEVFYSADPDAERLNATTVSDAIIDYYDQLTDPIGPDEIIEVTSYRRMELPSRERIAGWALEAVIERLDEDYADPDGITETINESDVRPAALLLADEILKHYKSWTCEPVKTWTERVADHVPDEWMKEPPR